MVCDRAVYEKVFPVRLVVGQMQSRDGQNGSHDIVAIHTESNDGALPEIAPEASIRQCCRRKNAEIVQQFQVTQIKVWDRSSIRGIENI